MKGNRTTAVVIIAVALLVSFVSARSFGKMHTEEPIVPGPGVTSVKMLSEYDPGLKGTAGDTEVYVMEGSNPGSSMLVLGGNHPNEPASMLSAVVLIENAQVEAGTLYVIPRANNSAFTHNDPQEGHPQRYTIETPEGDRWFRFGSRATNPIHQWPDPDVYIHASSGQQLSGSETRNLNRTFPGRENGTFTERISYGITKMIQQEAIDVTIDLHEASPEYPVVNAVVAHDRGMGIASQVVMNLQFEGIPIGLEPSPVSLRGLTHRELGDHTDTYAFLLETTNPAQGRLRGKTDEALVLTGIDSGYVRAQQMGRLFVPYDDTGHPIDERVARHVATVYEFSRIYSELSPESPVTITGLDSYHDMIVNGLGAYLNPPPESS